MVSHGSALLSCKVPTSVSVFLHLNVDLLKPYKSVLFVKREIFSIDGVILIPSYSAYGDSFTGFLMIVAVEGVIKDYEK